MHHLLEPAVLDQTEYVLVHPPETPHEHQVMIGAACRAQPRDGLHQRHHVLAGLHDSHPKKIGIVDSPLCAERLPREGIERTKDVTIGGIGRYRDHIGGYAIVFHDVPLDKL